MTPFARHEQIASLTSSRFDVVVIGAGMTGGGVAVDAAARGLRVALIDRDDFAAGTSSKSSKMVHGGLRYLQQKEFRLVYENLRERQRLLENAPYLVEPLPFLIPLFGSDGVASRALVKGYASALRLYDLTGGWRIGHRYERVTRDEVLRHFPNLRTDRLVAGFLYYDARGDDARVALTLAKTAVHSYGATAANYVRALDVTRGSDGRVTSVLARNELTGEAISIATASVVNATGVWADEIFSVTEHRPSHRVTPAKGVHLSVPHHRLPVDVAAVLNVPGDRRSIFVVPFTDAPYTYLGTTDTAYDGELDHPYCTPEDVDYLLQTVNASTSADLTSADVTGVWAGLRPLLAPEKGKRISERTADLSRRHQVLDTKDGVVHVTGGKWTTYRQMAEDTVDALSPYFDKLPAARTKHLGLYGVSGWRPSGPLGEHLYHRYGADAPNILSAIEEHPELGEPLIDGLPHVGAEFLFSAREEMATSLVDLLSRRTRAHLCDARATLAGADAVARLVAPVMGWDDDAVAVEVAAYRDLAVREFKTAGLSL